MDPTAERQVAIVAARQRGHVTRAQLRRAGMSWRAERRRVELGLLEPAGARTFRLAGRPPTLRDHAAAATLDLGGAATRRTSNWIHDLADPPPVIEIAVLGRRSSWVPPATTVPVRLHLTSSLPPDDVLLVDGIRTMSVARSIMSTAALVPDELGHDDLLELVTTAVERQKATMPWLWWILEARRCRGRNGVKAFEAALARRSEVGPTESWLEREVLRILAEAGLPRPQLQRVLCRDGRFAARVDFWYPPNIVIEVLGYAHHRTRDELLADTMRANELQLAGHEVYQFTARQVAERPDTFVATVAAALVRAGHRA